MSLSADSIESICRSVNRGARLVVARDAAGNRRIKVYRWPLGIFPQRWKCSEEEFTALKQKLQGKIPARRA